MSDQNNDQTQDSGSLPVRVVLAGGGGGGGGNIPVYNNQQAATGSAAALAARALSNNVVVQALPGNVGNVFVGGVGLTINNGYPLQPGQPMGFVTNNTNNVYIILDTGATGGVAWVGN
jgi:hypothetical protein